MIEPGPRRTMFDNARTGVLLFQGVKPWLRIQEDHRTTPALEIIHLLRLGQLNKLIPIASQTFLNFVVPFSFRHDLETLHLARFHPIPYFYCDCREGFRYPQLRTSKEHLLRCGLREQGGYLSSLPLHPFQRTWRRQSQLRASLFPPPTQDKGGLGASYCAHPSSTFFLPLLHHHHMGRLEISDCARPGSTLFFSPPQEDSLSVFNCAHAPSIF